MQQQLASFVCKQRLAHTSVKFSPLQPQWVAVASAANFGIVGKGIAQVKVMEAGRLKTLVSIQQPDSVFDVSWSQFHQQILLVGCGNGLVFLWNMQKGKLWTLQTGNEVQSVEMSYKTPLFLTTNMNGNLRVGDSEKGSFLFMLPAHRGSCYQAAWHPTSVKVFASGGGDGSLKLWDHSLPNQNIASIQAHQGQIMSVDFNKYEQLIATASTDKSIRIWDLRNLKIPVKILNGHRYPVKKVKFSPHSPTIIASGSYDMNIHIWDIKQPTMLLKHAQHTQFVTSVDFSLHQQNLIGSTSWDGRVLVWPWDKPQPIVT